MEVAFNPEFSAYGYLIATTGLESEAKLWDGGFEAAFAQRRRRPAGPATSRGLSAARRALCVAHVGG